MGLFSGIRGRRAISKAIKAQARLNKGKVVFEPGMTRAQKFGFRVGKEIGKVGLKKAYLETDLKIKEANRTGAMSHVWPVRLFTKAYWNWRVRKLSHKIVLRDNEIKALEKVSEAVRKEHAKEIEIIKQRMEKKNFPHEVKLKNAVAAVGIHFEATRDRQKRTLEKWLHTYAGLLENYNGHAKGELTAAVANLEKIDDPL